MQPLKFMSGSEVLMQPGAVLMSVASITTKGHVDLLTKALWMFQGHPELALPAVVWVQKSWPWTSLGAGELAPHNSTDVE